MSVDYELCDPVTGDVLPLPDGERLEGEGGTYVVGGWDTCELNVTYNYGPRYAEVIPDYPGMIEMLHGKHAAATIPMLKAAVEQLGTERDSNYWAGTRGNAGHALSILLSFADAHPEGKWVASG